MNEKIIFLIIILPLAIFACSSQTVIDLRENKQKNSPDAAILAAPIELDIIHVNRRKHDIITHYAETIRYSIAPGNHVIGLQYNDMVANEDDIKETIKSNIVELSFNAEKGQIYELRFDKPNSFTEAVALSSSLEVSLYSNEKLLTTSSNNDLWQLSSAVSAHQASSLDFDEQNTDDIPQPKASDRPSKHLIFWWKKANESEKQDFLQAIQE